MKCKICNRFNHRLHKFQKCIAGRSIIENVVLLDAFMHFLALLDLPFAAAILFDMINAFPSVYHPYLWAVLSKLGLPSIFVRGLQKLYANNKHRIKLAGKLYCGPHVTIGIKQGDPLSMILFALCLEPLLRHLEKLLDLAREMAGAFADDIGVVIADIRNTAPDLAKLFELFGKLSNLWLHPMKSVLIPLMPGVSLDAFKSELASIVPSWSMFSVTLAADYLGFKLGPDAHFTFWNSALKKANDTMRRWKAIHAGFFFNILAANVFILPLFSYLAQLADVSDIVDEVNQSMRSILFGGPGHWMPAGFLTSLKQIGFPAELHDFENHANAARIRTAQRVLPLLDEETRVEISRAMICFRVNNGADHPHWKWHETCYLTSITAAKEIFGSDDPAHLALLCEDTKQKCLKLQSKITALLNAKSQHCTAKLWGKLRTRLLR